MEQSALASVASQMRMINNKMKLIAYAKDFIDKSKEMHHLTGRWELAKKDKPKGFSVYGKLLMMRIENSTYVCKQFYISRRYYRILQDR